MNTPFSTAPATINLPLNQPGSQIAGLFNAHATRLDAAETNITNNANAIAALQADNTANKAAIAALQSAVSALQARMSTAESNITANATAIATLQSQVAAINTSLTALTARVTTNETNIAALYAHDSTQDQALSDLDHRVTALEQGGTVSPGGPFIGDLVHTTDSSGHCQPSIVYEDWDGRNANGTISIAVLSPARLSESPWDSYIEVHPQNGHVEPPFTTWHWPEMAFQYRRNLFRKVAAHGSRG